MGISISSGGQRAVQADQASSRRRSRRSRRPPGPRGPRPPRRRAAGAPRADRAEPAPGDRRRRGCSTVGAVPEDLGPGRPATSSTRAAAAVEVPEPCLAAEQREPVAQLVVLVDVHAGSAGFESTMPWSATTTSRTSAGSASRSCSASASIIGELLEPLLGGDAVPVAGPVEVAVVEVGQRRPVRGRRRPRRRSARRPGPRRRSSAPRCAAIGQPAAGRTRAC